MKTTARSEIANKQEHVESSRHAVPIGVAATLLEAYEVNVAIARERFDQNAVVRALFYGAIDPVTLGSFLISFAIIGVRITEPVEGWIRRAGRRCGELGLETLAKALTAGYDAVNAITGQYRPFYYRTAAPADASIEAAAAAHRVPFGAPPRDGKAMTKSGIGNYRDA